jgi:hypothetical protein
MLPSWQYYEDKETCSTSVVDITWFAVVYSYAHATILLVLVSFAVYWHLQCNAAARDYARISTMDYGNDSDLIQDTDYDDDHNDFAG